MLHVAPTGAIRSYCIAPRCSDRSNPEQRRSYWSNGGAISEQSEQCGAIRSNCFAHCSSLLCSLLLIALHCSSLLCPLLRGAILSNLSNGRSNESNVEQWSNGRLRARAILSNPGAIDPRVDTREWSPPPAAASAVGHDHRRVPPVEIILRVRVRG